jgi:hypothetical protein
MITKISAVCFALALVGCIDTGDTGDDPGVEATAKIASNGLVPTAIHSNGLNNVTLTGSALSGTKGMMETTDNRLYSAYIIGCALTPSQSVTASYQFVPYTFYGVMGLAPAWTTRPLTASETADVSACVIARANLTGMNVTISVRGDSPALATTLDERTNYNVEEAAFYGNVFTSTTGAKHACNGVDQVRDGDTYGDLPNRQCGQEDPTNRGYTLCGFVFDGNCADICTVNGDHYEECAGFSNVETIHLYGTAP